MWTLSSARSATRCCPGDPTATLTPAPSATPTPVAATPPTPVVHPTVAPAFRDVALGTQAEMFKKSA
jgi:hypothetical protein